MSAAATALAYYERLDAIDRELRRVAAELRVLEGRLADRPRSRSNATPSRLRLSSGPVTGTPRHVPFPLGATNGY